MKIIEIKGDLPNKDQYNLLIDDYANNTDFDHLILYARIFERDDSESFKVKH